MSLSKELISASWWQEMVPAHWLLSLSSGQGHVKRCVQRWLWAQEDLGSQSAGGWGLCSWLLIGKIPWRRGSLSLSLDVWLKYPSTGTYGLLVGPGLGVRMADSKTPHTTTMSAPWYLCHKCLCSYSKPKPSHFSRRPFKTSK